MRLDKKTFTFLGIFTAYILWTYFNYEMITNIIQNSGVIGGILLYILFNPAYLLIIYGIYTRYKNRRAWKRVVASVLSILSLDFLAVPRIGITEPLIDGSAISTNIGSIIMRAIESTGISHQFSYFIMYAILPFVGLMISVELLGLTNWIRENTK